MEEVEVGGERGVVMLRLGRRCLRRLCLVVVLEGVEMVGLRGRHQCPVRVAVLLLLRVVMIHVPLPTCGGDTDLLTDSKSWPQKDRGGWKSGRGRRRQAEHQRRGTASGGRHLSCMGVAYMS